MDNSRIAEIFEEIADMLELDPKANKFEPLAYRKAALTIGSLQQDIAEIYNKEGIEGLTKLPGVGKTIAERIEEYIKTGTIKKYEELKAKFPVDFADLTRIQGMGAKKAFKLYQMLGIRNVEELKQAIAQHKIRELEGFGEKSEEELAKGIALLEESKGRMLLGTALPEAESLISKLKNSSHMRVDAENARDWRISSPVAYFEEGRRSNGFCHKDAGNRARNSEGPDKDNSLAEDRSEL